MSETDVTSTRQTAKKTVRRRADAVLHIIDPSEVAGALALDEAPVVLGREPGDDAQPRVPHPTVSRRHLSITWDKGTSQHVAQDLGSYNGTWLEGRKLGEAREPLSHGHVLRLGDVLAVYEHGKDAHAEPPRTDVSRASIPGIAAAAHALRRSVERAAPDPSPALLIGETGTGKEWIARELHRLSGRRGPWQAINCAELSPELIESQLFGHERGAFTGADRAQPGIFRAAEGGTVFLDEIGELPTSLQPKLLRVLQEWEVRPVGGTRSFPVDVRVIAATNRDLTADVDSGDFRRDLYARLALWEIRVPRLADRRADILDWIRRFHAVWCERRHVSKPHPGFEPEAAELLLLHDWPDNLRGLDRLVHHFAAHHDEEEPITTEEVEAFLPTPAAPDEEESEEAAAKRPAPTKEELVATLARLDGSVRATAKYYGRDRRQVYRWLKQFGLRD